MKVETVIGTLQAALVLDVQRSGLVPNVERSADSLVRVRQFARPTRNTSYFAPGHKHKKRGQGCPRSVPALPFCSHFSPRHSPLDTAFSLIEILITVGLLSFIILGLLLMFNQVQRAFRSSTTQADILEAGRAVADMLARELEEMTPSHIAYKPGKLRSINFMTEIESPAYGHYDFGDPLRQFLPGATMPDGSGPTRTNIVQEFFFMRKLNQDYVGTGYLVVPHYSNAVTDVSVGSLYRYAVSTNKNAALSLGWNFVNGPNFTDLHR